MPPRPPISTLFPYTTLFRSESRRGRSARAVGGSRAQARLEVRRRHVPVRQGPRRPRARAHVPEGRQPPRRVDRKSTRLNSSHVEISYAVFCLKKKKNTNKKT